MPLGIAIVIVFILYLIDKHNRWRQVLRAAVSLVVLAILGGSALFGWEKYQAYREEKQEQAEALAQQARVSACISRLKKTPIPKDALEADLPRDIQSACDANPYTTTYQYQPALILPSDATLAPSKLKAPRALGWAVVTTNFFPVVKRCAFGVGDLPCGYLDTSNGEIAHLNKGDRVKILSDRMRAPDGTEIYELNFQQWTGWGNADGLSIEPSAQEGENELK